MTEQSFSNPLREGLVSRATPQPCSIVIFGATGDLTHRKLVPALYNLAADGDLPPGLAVVGFARRDKTDEVFRQELSEAAHKYSRQKINEDLWKNFANSIFYHRSEFGDPEGYRRLKERLEQIDRERGTRGNRIFYLSAGPDQFEPILTHLEAAGSESESERRMGPSYRGEAVRNRFAERGNVKHGGSERFRGS